MTDSRQVRKLPRNHRIELRNEGMEANEDQLRALGRLTTEFSLLETMVQLVILGLLNEAEQQNGIMILTAQLSFARLCDAAAAIARERMKDVPAAVDELKKLLKRAGNLAKERNRLIHSVWLPIPGDPSGLLSRIKITAKGKLDIQFVPNVPAKDLYCVADEISTATADLWTFLKQHGQHPQ